MLKKARLADQLNDQLSHRPGPLELIKKNILHTEETIETAVKSGILAFKATSEGASGRPQHPSSYCGPPDEVRQLSSSSVVDYRYIDINCQNSLLNSEPYISYITLLKRHCQ